MIRLLAVCLALVGCSSVSHAVQVKAADAVGQAANQAGPVLLAEYKRQEMKCVTDATSRIDADSCRTKLEAAWVPVKLAMVGLVRAQDDYATALEKHEADPSEYVFWLRSAFCELKFRSPVKLPDVPGFPCEAP